MSLLVIVTVRYGELLILFNCGKYAVIVHDCVCDCINFVMGSS